MHFYAEEDGKVKPKHFVPMSKDPSKTRPSRTTDAKKAAKNGEIWYPSVTGVLNILDKPALVNWKVDKHLEQAYNLAVAGFDKDTWFKSVKSETQKAMDSAPKAGTDIHQVLEDYLYTGSYPHNEIEAKIVANCEDVIRENVEGGLWNKEEYFINENNGYAGCADLVSHKWVIDYKSKQEAVKFKPGKMAYPEHSRQLAAYGAALIGESFGEEGFKAANIFVCLETGEVDFHQHDQDKIYNGWLDFLDCLSIYSRNTYKAGK